MLGFGSSAFDARKVYSVALGSGFSGSVSVSGSRVKVGVCSFSFCIRICIRSSRAFASFGFSARIVSVRYVGFVSKFKDRVRYKRFEVAFSAKVFFGSVSFTSV